MTLWYGTTTKPVEYSSPLLRLWNYTWVYLWQ